MEMNRRQFVKAAGMAAGAACVAGCETAFVGLENLDGPDAYSVSVLGDTHFDTEPESVYHSHYDESNKWAKIQHEEFRRNGEMWRARCRELLASSARLAHEQETLFVLQLGDIIQGDCDDVPTHKKMLDDCIKMLREPYPANLPFLTVVGNHDFRGKGAWDAYFQFAEPFMSREIGKTVKYPAFSFRQGKDLWVFCNFETKDLNPIADLIDADPAARRVFLVTHGPFTAFECGGSYRWRLGGRKTAKRRARGSTRRCRAGTRSSFPATRIRRTSIATRIGSAGFRSSRSIRYGRSRSWRQARRSRTRRPTTGSLASRGFPPRSART